MTTVFLDTFTIGSPGDKMHDRPPDIGPSWTDLAGIPDTPSDLRGVAQNNIDNLDANAGAWSLTSPAGAAELDQGWPFSLPVLVPKGETYVKFSFTIHALTES